MRRFLFTLLVVSALFAALVWAGEVGVVPVVITRVGEQKVVLLFGSPVSVQTKPGLSLRLPFFSNVLTFDRRFLYFNSEPQQMQTRDAERPVVDHYVVWRIADPLKFLTKEDFVPPQGDKFLHTLAPCMALFTALVTFAVIPFGDVLVLGERVINLQVANLNICILYVFAMGSLGVYLIFGENGKAAAAPPE